MPVAKSDVRGALAVSICVLDISYPKYQSRQHCIESGAVRLTDVSSNGRDASRGKPSGRPGFATVADATCGVFAAYIYNILPSGGRRWPHPYQIPKIFARSFPGWALSRRVRA